MQLQQIYELTFSMFSTVIFLTSLISVRTLLMVSAFRSFEKYFRRSSKCVLYCASSS